MDIAVQTVRHSLTAVRMDSAGQTVITLTSTVVESFEHHAILRLHEVCSGVRCGILISSWKMSRFVSITLHSVTSVIARCCVFLFGFVLLHFLHGHEYRRGARFRAEDYTRVSLQSGDLLQRAGVWGLRNLFVIGWEHPMGCIVCRSICLPGFGSEKQTALEFCMAKGWRVICVGTHCGTLFCELLF